MPQTLRHYEPLGDVFLNFGHGVDPPSHYRHNAGIPIMADAAYVEDSTAQATSYTRLLDLRTGVATTTYSYSGYRYKREVLSSLEDEVICIEISSNAEIRFFVSLNWGDDMDWDRKLSKAFDSLVPITHGHLLTGSTSGKGGVEFFLGFKVLAGGSGSVFNLGIHTATGDVLIFIAGEITFRHPDALMATRESHGKICWLRTALDSRLCTSELNSVKGINVLFA